MSLELLTPISDEIVSSVGLLPKQILGKSIAIHTQNDGLPDLKEASIALIGVNENRNSFFQAKHITYTILEKNFMLFFQGTGSQI